MNKKRYVIAVVTCIAMVLIALPLIDWGSYFRSDIRVAQSSPAKSTEKLLPPQIKHAVNQALAPEGITYPKVENSQGITIDVSQRAASVSTAVIDEKGQVHIVDYTSPIKE